VRGSRHLGTSLTGWVCHEAPAFQILTLLVAVSLVWKLAVLLTPHAREQRVSRKSPWEATLTCCCARVFYEVVLQTVLGVGLGMNIGANAQLVCKDKGQTVSGLHSDPEEVYRVKSRACLSRNPPRGPDS